MYDWRVQSKFHCRKPIENKMINSDSLSGVDEEGGVEQYREEMLEIRKTLLSKANTNIKIIKRGTMTENIIAKWLVHFQFLPAIYVSRFEVHFKLVAGHYVSIQMVLLKCLLSSYSSRKLLFFHTHKCTHMPRSTQEWKTGTLEWLRNSAQDTRKKILPRWLGPYKIIKCLDKKVYRLQGCQLVTF